MIFFDQQAQPVAEFKFLDRFIGKERRLLRFPGGSPFGQQPVVGAVLGVGLVFAAGFADKLEVHNAAHDARHSAAFPCH